MDNQLISSDKPSYLKVNVYEILRANKKAIEDVTEDLSFRVKFLVKNEQTKKQITILCNKNNVRAVSVRGILILTTVADVGAQEITFNRFCAMLSFCHYQAVKRSLNENKKVIMTIPSLLKDAPEFTDKITEAMKILGGPGCHFIPAMIMQENGVDLLDAEAFGSLAICLLVDYVRYCKQNRQISITMTEFLDDPNLREEGSSFIKAVRNLGVSLIEQSERVEANLVICNSILRQSIGLQSKIDASKANDVLLLLLSCMKS